LEDTSLQYFRFVVGLLHTGASISLCQLAAGFWLVRLTLKSGNESLISTITLNDISTNMHPCCQRKSVEISHRRFLWRLRFILFRCRPCIRRTMPPVWVYHLVALENGKEELSHRDQDDTDEKYQ
jgi:hypothetical protein